MLILSFFSNLPHFSLKKTKITWKLNRNRVACAQYLTLNVCYFVHHLLLKKAMSLFNVSFPYTHFTIFLLLLLSFKCSLVLYSGNCCSSRRLRQFIFCDVQAAHKLILRFTKWNGAKWMERNRFRFDMDILYVTFWI